MLSIHQYDDAHSFLAACGPLLEAREAENNLPLGIALALSRDPATYGQAPSLFLGLLQDGVPVGAALMTPPRRLILSRFDLTAKAAAVALVGHLAATSLPGVVGPRAEAAAFAAAWHTAHPDQTPTLHMRMRVFEAREVADVPRPQGGLRPAAQTDHAQVSVWLQAFAQATGEPADARAAAQSATRFIAAGQLYVWDDDGPVCMVKASRPMRRGTSINAVYTPPENRRHGYATAAVAALTQKLFDQGYAFCSLYTDLANPTSNSIYARIGYRPLGDALAFDFAAA